MCLYPTKSREYGHKPLAMRVAWKVVDYNRKSVHYPKRGITWNAGKVFTVDPKKVRLRPIGEAYHEGFHVFRSKKTAENHFSWIIRSRLVKVAVRPQDWVAHNDEDAVYTRVRVLEVGRPKR